MKTKTFSVVKMFYSVQGEGGRMGEASLFLRLAGCNLKCPWCDTDHRPQERLTLTAIIKRLHALSSECRWLVITGGEPLLQLDAESLHTLRQHWALALETNGTMPLPGPFDYVTVSPKPGSPVIVEECDELRVPVTADTVGPPMGMHPKAVRRYLSPVFDGHGRVCPAALAKAVQWVGDQPNFWRLSCQMHKLVGVE